MILLRVGMISANMSGGGLTTTFCQDAPVAAFTQSGGWTNQQNVLLLPNNIRTRGSKAITQSNPKLAISCAADVKRLGRMRKKIFGHRRRKIFKEIRNQQEITEIAEVVKKNWERRELFFYLRFISVTSACSCKTSVLFWMGKIFGHKKRKTRKNGKQGLL